ncbi:MAG: hypothetical protein ABI658_10910 [Acidimicrobiales bacterium]
MLLSELFATQVHTADGRLLGPVRDVRLVQDGPLDGFTAKFRVDAIVVARRSVGLRLGYHHGGVRSPWVIRRVVTALSTEVHTIPWTDVADHDPEGQRLMLQATWKPAPS